MTNKIYVAMSVIILAASLVGIGIASVNFHNKLMESEKANAQLHQAELEAADVIRDTNAVLDGGK